MAFSGHTDEATLFCLRGSLTNHSFPSVTPYVDIVVNRRFVARLPARSFCFNPFETLLPGLNTVEVFVAGSDQLLENGTHQISGDLPESELAIQESSAPVGSFMDEVELLAGEHLGGKVWAFGEVLADAVQERGSQCERSPGEQDDFDLVLATNVCEHWFPSIAKELGRIHAALRPGGMACLDFLCEDAALSISRGWYDRGSAVFSRVYSEPELRSFFLEAGLEILEIAMYEDKRAIVAARKPGVAL